MDETGHKDLLESFFNDHNRWANELMRRYSQESQRRYHTWDHITSMFTNFSKNFTLSENDEKIITLAILFHDAVYDPKRSDNELQSIELFEQFWNDLKDGEKDIHVHDQVVQLIKATITHNLVSDVDKRVCEIFLDLDLEVLSRNEEEYKAYAKQIRQEYAHYPDEEFRNGRIRVLSNFIKRDKIYFTNTFSETRARDNLNSELALLKSSKEYCAFHAK